jgi:ppGpp synthetase/RelA/SpoT-type nucleotidyltranferase
MHHDRSEHLRELEAQYRVLAPLANRFADELAHQIERLLQDGGVSLSFPVQRRVKEWTSISEKLDRKALQLSAIRDLSDFVGLRVILQFQRDVERVCDAIRSHFMVQEEYDTAERLKEDQFGYSSYHFVVALPESWLKVPTLSSLHGFRAELQVRTTAQHIWAAASHTLQYKQEAAVPPTIRRAIHRVSALLETVDLEFERVLQERETYRDTATELPESEPLNVDLLESTLDGLLPGANKKAGEEPYSELLKDLEHFRINTRGELVQIITKNLEVIVAKDAERVRELTGVVERIEGVHVKDERLAAGVFYTHVGLCRAALSAEYGERWSTFSHAKSLQSAKRKSRLQHGA